MVRKFRLLNEIGQEYSLMDINNYCLLTEPNGLGISYNLEYELIGNTFINTSNTINQGQISGILNFLNYDNFTSFANFIRNSLKIKFGYEIPCKDGSTKEYFKDVMIKSITKTEKQQNGLITESIIFDCLSLWYQDKETVYTIAKLEDEIQWDFRWDSRFADYSARTIVFNNDGYSEASFKLEMFGYLINPGITVMQNEKIINSLILPIILQNNEKISYSSKDNDIYINKYNFDGSITNLFTHNYIDINNNNIFKIPKGTSEITLLADNDIYNAKINIFKECELF